MNLQKQQPLIGAITIISGILALASITAALIAANYNFDAFSDPLLILTTTGANAAAAKWSMILDMFGYYLLLLPSIYFLQDWLKSRSAWSSLITFSATSYVLIGAIGAAVLAIIWPAIINAYPSASAGEQLLLKSDFKLINDIVYGGLWNLLETLFAGTWWIMTGVALYRNKFSAFGIFTQVTGYFCLADSLSEIVQSPLLHEIALNGYLLLSIAWAITFGVILLRQKMKI